MLPTQIKKPGIPFPWLRNSAGKADAMLSFCTVIIAVTIMCFAFGGSSYTQDGGIIIKLRELDAAGLGMIIAGLAAYVVRRHEVGKKSPTPS